jgi:hypothetical protein
MRAAAAESSRKKVAVGGESSKHTDLFDYFLRAHKDSAWVLEQCTVVVDVAYIDVLCSLQVSRPVSTSLLA